MILELGVPRIREMKPYDYSAFITKANCLQKHMNELFRNPVREFDVMKDHA